MLYLFLGQDNLSKAKQFKLIKQENLSQKTEQFNLDILYAKDLNLKTLQEKLLWIPAASAKRIVVLKTAQALKDELKGFLLEYSQKQSKDIILILDFEQVDKRDSFVNQLAKHAQVFRFKETIQPDTFMLGRQIAAKRPDSALRILNQLLEEGEKPERILGGLRYVWEKDALSSIESRRRLKLLLNCDLEIKTGRIRPVFALEKLVVSLCALTKSLS